ncbi:beta-galactosidase [Microbacterium sp. NPDC091313]
MTPASRLSTRALTVVHRPWDTPIRRPRMSNERDRHRRYALTDRYVERDGRPFIPISGELHYSRVPRSEWVERLRLMKSGGITAVASYLFWIHHEEVRGQARFDDNLDVRAFVELCRDVGLDVVLRIGPWCHGEVRNGGFPDWVQAASVAHRTDDPRYLALVRPWYAAIAAQLAGLFGADGPVIAIQIENELYDQPGHIATLKRLAEEVGMSAPIWTATGWGGAQLPEDEVMPLFGGYADGFWVDYDQPWDVTFREHFFFSHVWDDPGIGADLRAHAGIGGGGARRPLRTPSALYPAATCELGGGMAKAYHRRPQLSAADIAAVAHNKIGNGSAWQGYYMYAGGTNPASPIGLQESHATGYPNDLARFDYDFAAPIGATGRLTATHAVLRRQHAFLSAFGEMLATMPSTLPETLPSGVDDAETLRWALRSDGETGFVFIGWHQPHVALPDYADAQFRLGLGQSVVELPDRPVDIPAGTVAHWPVDLVVGAVRMRWATASPLTILPGEVPTLVLVAERGIDARLALAEDAVIAHLRGARLVDDVVTVDPAAPAVLRATAAAGELDILVIPSTLADDVWVLGDGDARELLLSTQPLWLDGDGRLSGTYAGESPVVHRYDRGDRTFRPAAIAVTTSARPSTPVPHERASARREPPASYGSYDGRASAPADADWDAFAETFALTLPEWALGRGEITLAWAGDAARLLVDGDPVADQFWSGAAWDIAVAPLGLDTSSRITLQILPLHPEAEVHLPAPAAQRRRAAAGALVAVDAISVCERGRWRETSRT